MDVVDKDGCGRRGRVRRTRTGATDEDGEENGWHSRRRTRTAAQRGRCRAQYQGNGNRGSFFDNPRTAVLSKKAQ